MPGQRYLERTWAVEGTGGFAFPLTQQFVAVCEPVFTCDRSWAPFPAAGDRQRQQNDPNDARSVGTAALRSTDPRLVDAEGPAAGAAPAVR